jgi:hypothetical protein
VAKKRLDEAAWRPAIRAGRILEEGSVFLVPMVQDWVRRVATDLQQRLPEGKRGYFGGAPLGLVIAVWSQVLARCVNARHGSAFVILDPQDTTNTVRFQYGMESLDIGEAIVDFLLASIKATDSQKPEDHRSWLRYHNMFRKQVDVISSIANIDGCVALTPDLRLFGFGGEIF